MAFRNWHKALLAAALVSASGASFALSSNGPPTISGTPPTTVAPGKQYFFQPRALDPEGTTLQFSIANKPAWATFSSWNGRLSGTPTSANAGTTSGVVISVSDGVNRTALPAFSVTVTGGSTTNRPPTITGSPASSVNVGSQYLFQPSASDPDGQVLSYTISNKPTWASFDITTGRLSGTPSSAGTTSGITITVSDGALSASLPAFSVTVNGSGNRAPTISGSPSASVTVGSQYVFQPSASDPDGQTLAFSISGKPSWASFSTSSGRLSGTPAAGQEGVYSGIAISVSDGQASASLATFSVTVQATAPPPPPPPPSGSQPLGYYTDMVSAPVGAYVTAYGSGFGGSGTVSLGGANQQVFSYSDTKVVFTVSGNGGELIVGGRNLGQLRVHAGRVFTVTTSTIKTALAGWQAGDVYYLRGGTYSGVLKSDNWNFSSNFDIIQSPATADRPIAIVGYPGEVATLTGTGSRPNFIFANSGGGSKASNMVVANLNLIAPNTCVDSGGSVTAENRGGENLRIVGNVCTISATGNTMTGMMNFAGNGSTILGNTFVDNPARQIINNNHALYVHAGADNVTVGYNVFRNLRMGHVVQVHQDGVAYNYMNIKIHDNLLQAVNNGDMRGITVSNVSSASTVFIERNTLRNVGQDFSGISVYGGIVTVKDNKFYGIRATNISLNGMALGSSGSQQRRVTASGNRFETVNGYAAIQAVAGASMNEITLSGNSYCGLLPILQDLNLGICN